jgi:hypothetical protein
MTATFAGSAYRTPSAGVRQTSTTAVTSWVHTSTPPDSNTNADNTTGFGFVRDARGHYRRLPDVPGALVTLPQGLNNRGQIVGLYIDADGNQHGYLLERGRLMNDAFRQARPQAVAVLTRVPVPTLRTASGLRPCLLQPRVPWSTIARHLPD